MTTTRESILAALHALLQTQPAPVLRGEVLPERVPSAGVLILRDGDPGEPAVTLSPLRYHYQHRAEVEAVVQAGSGRDVAFDDLAAVESCLQRLMEWTPDPLATRLSRQAGYKEARYAHLLSGPVDSLPEPAAAPRASEPDRLERLENAVEALQNEVAALRSEVEAFRRQFE